MKQISEEIQELITEYLKHNDIKRPRRRRKKNTFVPTGILTIYQYGMTERVL